MVSTLVITPVEKLQEKINKVVKSLQDKTGIYISLNKTQKSTQKNLAESGIDTKKIFFIDCVTQKKERDDVLHIPPKDLDSLNCAISSFIKEITGKKFLIIDALSTLLIYNDENSVAAFVKEVTNNSKEVEIFAFSPITKGEELLNKIFNFFDNVKKDENENQINQKGDLIY